MPGPVSDSSKGPRDDTPYVPSWCYRNGPRMCPCGHHEGYHVTDTPTTELVLLLADKVREMDEASDHARSWTRPGTCGIGPDMPCRHDRCITNAGRYAAYWTQLAARCAITLESLVGEHCDD